MALESFRCLFTKEMTSNEVSKTVGYLQSSFTSKYQPSQDPCRRFQVYMSHAHRYRQSSNDCSFTNCSSRHRSQFMKMGAISVKVNGIVEKSFCIPKCQTLSSQIFRGHHENYYPRGCYKSSIFGFLPTSHSGCMR